MPDPETGQPDPEKMMAFVAEHPETANALQLGLPKLAPTTSFATSGYNGLHAFGLVDADGDEPWGRYSGSRSRASSTSARRRARPPTATTSSTRSASGWTGGKADFRLDFKLAAEGDSLTTRPRTGRATARSSPSARSPSPT